MISGVSILPRSKRYTVRLWLADLRQPQRKKKEGDSVCSQETKDRHRVDCDELTTIDSLYGGQSTRPRGTLHCQ
jgi:hypothetical protein